MAKYIIAHDVGTSRSKAVLVDVSGHVHSKCAESYKVYHPRSGRAEQEPTDWWNAVVRTTRRLLDEAGVAPSDVLCITYSTQMLGIVPMDVESGPLRRAIIWLDSRASAQASRMMRRFGGGRIFALLAGTALCGKDCIPKLLWLKEEEPEVYHKMCCFLDVAGYLIYRSTGRMVMEWTGASTFALDLKKKTWLKGVMRYAGFDPAKCPPLVRPTEQAGVLTAEAARECGLLEGTPVIASAGDAPAAAVGSGAVGEGDGHVYLGTSGWVAVMTKRTPRGKCGVAAIQSADPSKAFLIGETETAGACLEWIADTMYASEKAGAEAADIYGLMDERVAAIAPGADGVLFTPWMCGERAPVTDCTVRSSFLNVCAHHAREHLLRAVYEGVAYNMRWLVEIIEDGFGFRLSRLRVIGGGARSAPWMQILADVTGRNVETVYNPQEAGAVGAALVAAVGLGIYPDFDALKNIVAVERVFEPEQANRALYDSLYGSYRQAYRCLRGFYRQMNGARSE
ncbi:MAG: FGGY-family carbohydrate kinase [Armatimonadota bacterium]|nr:MAG: FGGY-family carbohydrate kinase [Armatimonadota bacterium]